MDDQRADRKGGAVKFARAVAWLYAVIVVALISLGLYGMERILLAVLFFALLAPLRWLAWRFVPQSAHDRVNQRKN